MFLTTVIFGKSAMLEHIVKGNDFTERREVLIFYSQKVTALDSEDTAQDVMIKRDVTGIRIDGSLKKIDRAGNNLVVHFSVAVDKAGT